MPTPREETPAEVPPRNSTHKLLSAVGKKLAASAVSASASNVSTGKRRREASAVPEKRAYKRRKGLPAKTSTGRPVGRPRKVQVKGLLRGAWSRSGRAQIPSVKAREGDPPVKRKRGRPRLHPLPEPGQAAPPRPAPAKPKAATVAVKRAAAVSAPPKLPVPTRARPTSAAMDVDSSDDIVPKTESASAPVSSSSVRTAKSRAVDDQPRESNGRFGKKAATNGMYVRRRFGVAPPSRRTRSQRAEQRGQTQEDDADGDEDGEGARTGDGDTEMAEDEHRPKRPRYDDVGEEASSRSVSRVARRAVGNGLSFAPNPIAFARRAWATAPATRPNLRPAPDRDVVEVASTDDEDDSDGPVTPEDAGSLPVRVTHEEVPDDEVEELVLKMPARTRLSSGSTLWKPSPVNFATRRWSSVHTPADDADEPTLKPRDARQRAQLPDQGLWVQRAATSSRWDFFESASSSGEEVC
ncbi:hypothetical protein FA95DRAFT_141067 [Auriscalpium vulgare]|uniref:Uncharacterized protein n=1 Tax=Auriscalpium vulgare TaxID=40419 RepID=A0ACB8S6M3_9AGAM|nr:hypothetical protein FA95DRAFT_141067 [Auriscalpium vulgare]